MLCTLLGVALNCGENCSFIYVLKKLLFLFFNVKFFFQMVHELVQVCLAYTPKNGWLLHLQDS